MNNRAMKYETLCREQTDILDDYYQRGMNSTAVSKNLKLKAGLKKQPSRQIVL